LNGGNISPTHPISRITLGVKPHGSITGDELKETFSAKVALSFGWKCDRSQLFWEAFG
jgi:hypothetical protein